MRVKLSLILDEDLVDRARRLTGIREPAALVTAGLEALIARCNAARRLPALGGSDPKLRPIPRRRSNKARRPS
jgi:hypothetical protein